MRAVPAQVRRGPQRRGGTRPRRAGCRPRQPRAACWADRCRHDRVGRRPARSRSGACEAAARAEARAKRCRRGACRAHHAQHGPAASIDARRAEADPGARRRAHRHGEAAIGYLHRGIEKLAESRRYSAVGTLLDRGDYVSGIHNELAFALATENLLEVEVPRRAQWLRCLVGELNRIASPHLLVRADGPGHRRDGRVPLHVPRPRNDPRHP